MTIDRQDSIVVVPRGYTGSPIIAYSPTFLIITKRCLDKYPESMLFDKDRTTVIILPE
jgi:hypothetical protein